MQCRRISELEASQGFMAKMNKLPLKRNLDKFSSKFWKAIISKVLSIVKGTDLNFEIYKTGL